MNNFSQMKYLYTTLSLIILLLIIFFSCTGESKKNKSLSVPESNYVKQLDNELQKIFPIDKPGAAVIAYQNGRVIFRKAYGLANVELMVPMKPEMIFKIGSISKQFTAISIMILNERGLLPLDNPISMYLPDCTAKSQLIKIKNLLSHTSGIKNYNDIPVFNSIIRDPFSPDEMIDIIKSQPPDFVPGKQWAYSNSGYILLARIVEIISNQPFDQFVIKNIFEPAGMKNSYYIRDYEIIPNLVSGYRIEDGKLLKAEYMSMTHTYGGGDICTNVDDMVLYMDALLNKKLVSEKSLQYCFTPFVLDNGDETDYGFGWFCGHFQGYKVLYHGGGVYGFVSHSMYIPDKNIYVVILRNCVDPYTDTPTSAIGDMITATLLGVSESTGERIAIRLSEDQLYKYQGVYQFETGGKRRIAYDGNKLYYEIPPRKKENPWSKTEIIPESKVLFFAEGRKSTISFHFDDAENIIGFTVNQPFGRKVSAKKIN